MRLRNFLVPLFLVVLIGFVIAQTCNSPGYYNSSEYCDLDGQTEALKSDGDVCVNDYECRNQSCTDGLCQGKYDVVVVSNNTGLIQEIFNIVQGIECNPLNQTYHCEVNDTHAYLCGTNAVWEDKGEIPGQCGVALFTCGDGNVTGTEQCDDGNNWSNDSCKADCTFNICGDSSIYVGIEECDDGNNITGDNCNDECLIETCVVVNATNCSGFYVSLCNDSYLWEPVNLTLGECGVECLPVGNESCNDSNYFLCNASYVWSDRGLVNGKCGYSSGGGGGGGSSSSRSRSDLLDILVYSPINDITYSVNRLSLEVADPNFKAEYWKYSLNGAKKLDFIPNTTIFPSEGHNTLIVFAREELVSDDEVAKLVEFDVILSSSSGYCGDNLCQESENCEICVSDCGECPFVENVFCGNDDCDTEESSYSCPADCIAAERTDYTYLAVGVLASSFAVLGFVLYRRFFSGASQILDPRGE